MRGLSADERINLGTGASDMTSAYRTEEVPPPQYVCIVCFKGASMSPGPCMACCAAPLHSIDEIEVTDEIRKHADKVLSRRRRNETALIVSSAALLSIGLFGTLLVTGVYDLDIHTHHSSARGGMGDLWPLGVSFAVFFMLFLIGYPRVFKRSALASAFDPMTAPIATVLEWVGFKQPAPISNKTEP